MLSGDTTSPTKRCRLACRGGRCLAYLVPPDAFPILLGSYHDQALLRGSCAATSTRVGGSPAPTPTVSLRRSTGISGWPCTTHGSKLQSQGLPGILEDRPGGDRGLEVAVTGTLKTPRLYSRYSRQVSSETNQCSYSRIVFGYPAMSRDTILGEYKSRVHRPIAFLGNVYFWGGAQTSSKNK